MNLLDPLFRKLNSIHPLDATDLALIGGIFVPLRIARGEAFIKLGEIPKRMGFVVEGLLRSHFIDRDGNDHTRCFFDRDSFVMAYADLVAGTRTRFAVEALEDCELLVADFREIDQSRYSWLYITNHMCNQQLRYKHERELAFMTQSGAERYRRFQKQYPGLEDRVRQYHLASYLGLTPVSLSRIKGKASQALPELPSINK
jgi:CRP-like cAMP-binding protein